MNKHYKIIFTSIFLFILIGSPALFAHCEIPCGIYNDKLRIDLLKEHTDTIEKSMKQIAELSAAGEENYNQLIRWVVNKEEHANQFQHIVTQYFMTQRIKMPEDSSVKEAYLNKLSLLHELLVLAMKSKQTTDIENCNKMRQVIDTFSNAYFGKEELQHLKEHK